MTVDQTDKQTDGHSKMLKDVVMKEQTFVEFICFALFFLFLTHLRGHMICHMTSLAWSHDSSHDLARLAGGLKTGGSSVGHSQEVC